MRRTLVFLLGIWAFAAPSACLALCPETATAAEFVSADAEQPVAPCHQTGPSHRNAQDPESTSAPGSNDGCCLEQQLGPIQAGALEPLRAPLVFVLRTTPEIVDAIAPAFVSSLLRKVSWIRTPHLQANPPLLI